MDLGIADKQALVCGGSSGLGKAIATALAEEGVRLILVARTEDKLATAASEISELTGHTPEVLAVDLSDPVSRQGVVDRCQELDILVNNSGGPPVGDFRKLSREDWLSAIESNMLSAIDLINASLPGMCDRGFGRILNVTSHMVKAPVSFLSLSNGARAGLTGFVSGIARDVAPYNVTINNLLPGQFETDRLVSNHERFASASGQTVEEFQAKSKRGIPAGRFGQPQEFGAYAAFLCGASAGFVTVQNLLLDGGQYPGIM